MKPDNFRQIYAIGAAGGHSPYDFRIGFYNDTPKMFGDVSESRVIQRRVEAEIILSPVAALELSRWLTQHINEYESVFGPIARAIPRPKKILQSLLTKVRIFRVISDPGSSQDKIDKDPG